MILTFDRLFDSIEAKLGSQLFSGGNHQMMSLLLFWMLKHMWGNLDWKAILDHRYSEVVKCIVHTRSISGEISFSGLSCIVVFLYHDEMAATLGCPYNIIDEH